MKVYILVTLLFFGFVSCKSQMKDDINMEVEINFYPSSGGSVIYSIDLSGDSLTIKNLESSDRDNALYKRTLSADEIKEVKDIVKNLKQRNDLETEIILDSWRAEVIVNGTKYYNESDIRLNLLPEDVKKLLFFLIDGSSVKIDLFGFS